MIQFPRRRSRQHGFTLTELAVVLVIVALLISGAALTFSVQNEARERADTQRTLEAARDALVGFVLQNGRLPCPGQPASNGQESGWTPATGACLNPEGLLPAVTLGLGPVDPGGFMRDAWGTTNANRIRYRVSNAGSSAAPTCPAPIANVFTATNGMKNAGFNCLNPDVVVCATAGGNPATNCGASPVTFNTMAVIWSLGKNAPTGPETADEQENNDNDQFFVEHRVTSRGTTEGHFDDMVVWISPNLLYHRMIAAGAL